MAGKYTEAQAKATKKYQENNKEKLAEYHKEYEANLSCIKLRMTKEQKEIVTEKAKAEGKSLNKYVLDKILQ